MPYMDPMGCGKCIKHLPLQTSLVHAKVERLGVSTEQLKEHWLFRVYRGLYYPVMWEFM